MAAIGDDAYGVKAAITQPVVPYAGNGLLKRTGVVSGVNSVKRKDGIASAFSFSRSIWEGAIMIGFTSAKKNKVHNMHIDAFALYAGAKDIYIKRFYDGIFVFMDLILNAAKRKKGIFVQSTGLSNIITFPFARILGFKVFYYLHEPTSFYTKLRHDGLIKASLMQLTQQYDCFWSSVVFVSSADLTKKCSHYFFGSRGKIAVAPLLMSPAPSVRGDRFRITYLGRPDERRYLREFVENAERFQNVGLTPTILANNDSAFQMIIKGIDDKNMNVLDIVSTKPFDESVKSAILSETKVLWNPKRVEIAQSGVTADAVRFGIPVILTRFDPEYENLINANLAIDFSEFMVSPRELCGFDSANMLAMFSESHGEKAFDRYYAEIFNSVRN